MDYEVVKDRLYLRVVSGSAVNVRLPASDGEHCFVVEDLLVYLPFFLDYGPLSLGCLFKFCQMVNNKLTDRQLFDKRVVLCCSPKVAARHNAVYLLAAHSLLCLGRSPEEAIRPFARMSPPLAPWHDASPMVDTFHLSTLDVLRGIAKAVQFKFFDMDAFDVAEYEHYERVEAGDMNWLVQGRFLAFAGPHDSRSSPSQGYMTTTVEDVLPYFKSKGVSAVVRLNKKYYNERRFVAVGIAHHDMYYLDGSNPPEHILQRFLATAEATPGAIAVHCKAGLGRTGSCIGAYLMKHYRLTAREVIGWMRVCRPGSVIGPQQHYLEDVQARMWEEGDAFRASRTLPQPAPGSPLAVFNAGVGEQGRQSSGESGCVESSLPRPAYPISRPTHPPLSAPQLEQGPSARGESPLLLAPWSRGHEHAARVPDRTCGPGHGQDDEHGRRVVPFLA
jgi:cell division cycle 14